MIGDLALLLWAFSLGWMLARWKQPPPTTEHLVGAKLMSQAKDAVFTARMIGSGFRAVNTCTLNLDDGSKAQVTLSVEGAWHRADA